MDIYSIFIMIVILLSFFIGSKSNHSKRYICNKKIYCIFIGGLLFLIAALRSTSVGYDSGQYARHYANLQYLNIKGILDVYPDELGFYFLTKMLTLITSNHQLLFVVIGGLYAYSISRFIYKYSSDPMISFIMLITMEYYAFSLSGLRQTVAFSLALISIDFIKSRKFHSFLLILLVASFFHQSVLFFIPAYFLNRNCISNKRVKFYVLLVPIVFILRRPLLTILQNYIYSNYSLISRGENTGGWATLLVYILIFFVALLFKSQLSKNDNFQLFFSMMYFGALIQMFVPLQPNIFRVGMYYNIASIILIPGILKTQKDKFSILIAYSMFFVFMGIQYYLFTFYAAGMNPYTFFWQ